jgi:hypothetical protein
MEKHMTYAAHHRDLVPCSGEKSSTSGNAIANRPSALRRILNRIFESRQSQADRDIAQFVIRSGGRLTDEIEREMTQRLFKGNWNPC